MSKRRVHIDPKLPTPAAIAKHKDFNEVLEKHRSITQRPKYNAIKVITGLMLIAVIGALVFDAIESEERAIQPPLPNHELPYDAFLIHPDSHSTVVLSDGTTLGIPAGAFVDEDGSQPAEPVLIKAKTFRNPVDFFLSGIPMTYDSAGSSYTFSSAGMLEVEAFANRGKLQLADEKSVQVSIPSDLKGTYGIFEFDTLENRWMRRARSNETFVQQDTMVESIVSDDSAVVESSVSVIITEDGVYDTLCDTFDISSVEMEEAEVQALSWKERARQKRQKMIALEKEKRAAQRQLMQSFANRDAEMMRWSRRVDSINRAYREQVNRSNELIRSFEMTSLGIWNCDNPILNEFPHALALKVSIDGVTRDLNALVYHTDLGTNALFKYYANFPTVKYDSDRANLLWFAIGKDTVGIVDTAAFKEAHQFQTDFAAELLPADSAIVRLRSIMRKMKT